MQMLVVGFDGNHFTGEILSELRRLREHDVVRLVDMLLVSKDSDGAVTRLQTSDLSAEESAELGALASALIGLDDESDSAAAELSELHEDVWFVGDAIPPSTSAAVAILEHRWAIPLRESIERAGGKPLADAWLHPADLAGLGALGAVAPT